MSGLEGKVQRLVADSLAEGCKDDRDLMSTLAAYLSKHGLKAVVMAPPKPNAASPLSTRSINAPFLVVTQPRADDHRDEVSGDQDQFTNLEAVAPQMVIVDAALREHLALGPATPVYQRALEGIVPEVFIGTHTRLARLVSSLGPAIAANFSTQGMEQPPWRRKPALLHRWLKAEEEERLMQSEWEERRRVGVERALDEQQQQQQQLLRRPSLSENDLHKYEVAWPDGMPALDAAVCLSSVEVVPIVGFAVGSVAAGREPWFGTQPGAFSESFLRRTSLAESDTSSANSEDVMTGVSPISIFRDAPQPIAFHAHIKIHNAA
ncbi:hypothetical protein VaNZ11_013415 [Volvox africanus]|uniref:Uncharacterized protein n=1 Tax=Volvox africanus TaxID=51714 RepID=A0ABQ5SHI6_9CHLO|nr:hypothetical protein VaNZ11_013415 [Volvox africanus]